MTDQTEILATIREHNEVCRNLLEIVTDENHQLLGGGKDQSSGTDRSAQKQALLARLDPLREAISFHRKQLERAGQTGSQLASEISEAIEDGKRVIMKTVALDRENEKELLKQGRLAPGKLPAANAKRPDLVARTYQDQA